MYLQLKKYPITLKSKIISKQTAAMLQKSFLPCFENTNFIENPPPYILIKHMRKAEKLDSKKAAGLRTMRVLNHNRCSIQLLAL